MVEFDKDVVVVGGGLAGCIAARAISSRGLRVCVVDRVGEPRSEFRAEQLVGPQIEQLRALGLLEPMTAGAVRCTTTFNGRRGMIVDRSPVIQYGVAYRAMIAGVRAMLAPDALVVAKVAAIETSATRQIVRLADGRNLTARLVVVATGLLPHLLTSLGIGWQTISEAHSLCLGFDLVLHEPRGSHVLPLTYYGERVADRTDYLALFHIGDKVRANLFCYHGRDGAWTRHFAAEPEQRLRAVMPGLDRLTGGFSITSPVEARSNNIRVATNVLRDGMVVIGDAYQTPCPSAGTGIDRILSDVRALERHLPGWFAGNGIGAAQIAAYYDDPEKQAFDAECIRVARYRRAVSTETSLSWQAHRLRVFVQRRVMATLRSLQRRRPSIADIVGPAANPAGGPGVLTERGETA